MIRLKHILLRLLLVTLPVLLAMAPAMAQTNYAYVGQSFELSVVAVPGDTYSWELYNDVAGVNFAVDPGNCPQTEAVFTDGIATGPVVHVTMLKTGTYFFKVTARRSGCTMNLKVGKISAEHTLPTVNLSLGESSVCMGQTTNIEAHLTGTAPFSVTYRITYPDASTKDISVNNLAENLSLIPFNPPSAGTYTFEVISVTDAFTTNISPSNAVTVTVNPKPGSSHIYQYDPANKKK
jgi:hypothetical protein